MKWYLLFGWAGLLALFLFTPFSSRAANTVPPANPADVQAEINQITHYARYAEFWPVLKVSLNYSF